MNDIPKIDLGLYQETADNLIEPPPVPVKRRMLLGVASFLLYALIVSGFALLLVVMGVFHSAVANDDLTVWERDHSRHSWSTPPVAPKTVPYCRGGKCYALDDQLVIEPASRQVRNDED